MPNCISGCRKGSRQGVGVHPVGETAKPRTDGCLSLIETLKVEVKGMRGRGRRGALGERSGAHARQQSGSLQSVELGGRAVAQRRVQALLVVDLVDEGTDAARRLTVVAIEPAVDLL